MPSSSDNRSEPGRRRRDSFDGLRDLQRSTTDGDGSSRDRRRRPPPPTVRGVHSGADVAGPGLAGLANLEVGRRRRWPRRTLVLVNSFVALCLIAAVGAYAYIHHQLGNVTRVTASALSAQRSGPFTVLIIGSDSRDLSGAGNAQFGTASETPGQRSDTVMLARVVPKTHSLTLLSIPRDLYVPIAGMGDSRINSAFNTGPNLLISTIHTDLGIPINHFVEINFDTFEGITDAVGGVKVWFPTPARDAYSLLSVPTASPGPVTTSTRSTASG
jgi:anionic cell wall polymer biosynthesis LytR-Cps2A-Psr (LCP) family protein